MAEVLTPDFPTPSQYSQGNPVRYYFEKLYKPPIIIATFVLILMLNTFLIIWQGIVVSNCETQGWYLTLEFVLSIVIVFELMLRMFVLKNSKFCKKSSNILDLIFTSVSLLIAVSGFIATEDSIQVLAGWGLLLLRNIYLMIVVLYLKMHTENKRNSSKWLMDDCSPSEIMNEAFEKKKDSLPDIYKPQLSNIHEVEEKFEATESIAHSCLRETK